MNKQSLVNWLIVHDVDMTNNRVNLPDGWSWSKRSSEGFYSAIGTVNNVRTIVNMQDVALEIMNRLRRGNVRYERLLKR